MNQLNNKQNNNPKLSIMITFCNQKEFIKDAINSCLSQKYNFPIEILIGLDGEDVESEKIISEYIKQYDFIKLFKVDNSNLKTINIEKASINRLNLLKNATGEYICFLDGDDFYTDNNRFQELVSFLDDNSEYIAVFHDSQNFDSNQKTFLESSLYANKSKEIKIEDYLKEHRQFACFIYRNIFMQTIPKDLNISFVNDSTFTLYMLRYGKFYYINKPMLAYRVGIQSIYNSLLENKKIIYQLLAAEINHKTLSVAEKLLCKKYKKLIKSAFKIFLLRKNFIKDAEYKLISDFAKKQKCFFTFNLLNYSQLNFIKKIQLLISGFIYYFFEQNIAISKKNNRIIEYFNEQINFGDELNLYVLQRILDLNVQKNSKKSQLYAIGSILDWNIYCKFKTNIFTKSLKIWGTGLIKAKEKNKKEFFRRKIKVLALRGQYTKERTEKILNKKLNIPLGDPGLLAGKLLCVSNLKKKYLLGIIPHYMDRDIDFEKNIKINNYKIIDITKNPLFILKEIAECNLILSSAMHGLIASDSLGVPNRWIKLSDNLYGGDYKFYDYYSVYGITPNPLSLNDIINEELIRKIEEDYEKSGIRNKIPEIKNRLLAASKKL